MSGESTGFQFGEDRRREQSCRTVVTRSPPKPKQSLGLPVPPGFILRPFAGGLTVALSFFAGMIMGQQSWIQTVQTSQGDAIVIGQPGSDFWLAVGVGVLASLLLVYAMGGER